MNWLGKVYWNLDSFRQGLRHAFSLKEDDALTPEETALIERLAKAVVNRGMASPAILFLESLIPLSYLGSQAMHFMRPFMTFLFSKEEYDRLAILLEKRATIELLIEAIKKLEEEN